MGAADRFSKANTNFGVDRVKPLPPIYKEQKDDKGVTKLVGDQPGRYRVKIRRCLWVDPRKGPSLYIAEFDIVKSNNPAAPVGALFAYKQNMSVDAANTRVVEFVFAASGVDRRTAEGLAIIKEAEEADQIPVLLAESLEDETDAACKNALKDAYVDVEVEERISQDGFPYKHYAFFPVPQEAPPAETKK